MALTCSPASSVLSRTSSSSKRAAYASFKPAATVRTARVRVNAATQDAAEGAIDRRSMLAFSAVLPLMLQQSAVADDGAEFQTLLGMASPPTSYGGYGGNANEKPKYSFEYPTGWKTEVPSKVEKGTQGVDSRVVNPRGKDQRAFVITLTRAGEDDKSFRLTDIDSTFASFAGADYDLQDALNDAEDVKSVEVERNGVKFYDYEISSPSFHYLSSIAVKEGKVFALFVRSPTKSFSASEPKLRHIVETFRLL